MMAEHVNRMHKPTVTSRHMTSECNCFNNSDLAAFLILDSLIENPVSDEESFSGKLGTFGGGGASGSWDSPCNTESSGGSEPSACESGE